MAVGQEKVGIAGAGGRGQGAGGLHQIDRLAGAGVLRLHGHGAAGEDVHELPLLVGAGIAAIGIRKIGVGRFGGGADGDAREAVRGRGLGGLQALRARGVQEDGGAEGDLGIIPVGQGDDDVVHGAGDRAGIAMRKGIQYFSHRIIAPFARQPRL